MDDNNNKSRGVLFIILLFLIILSGLFTLYFYYIMPRQLAKIIKDNRKIPLVSEKMSKDISNSLKILNSRINRLGIKNEALKENLESINSTTLIKSFKKYRNSDIKNTDQAIDFFVKELKIKGINTQLIKEEIRKVKIEEFNKSINFLTENEILVKALYPVIREYLIEVTKK